MLTRDVAACSCANGVSTVNDTTLFVMDPQYRMAFVYFICGHAQLRDEEDTQDSRASMFLGQFTQMLIAGVGK